MAASRYLDRLAITLSTICIVHCLAMPFARRDSADRGVDRSAATRTFMP